MTMGVDTDGDGCIDMCMPIGTPAPTPMGSGMPGMGCDPKNNDATCCYGQCMEGEGGCQMDSDCRGSLSCGYTKMNKLMRLKVKMCYDKGTPMPTWVPTQSPTNMPTMPPTSPYPVYEMATGDFGTQICFINDQQ